MKAISSEQRRGIEAKREAERRAQWLRDHNDEVARAKYWQLRLGCSWSEALRAAHGATFTPVDSWGDMP